MGLNKRISLSEVQGLLAFFKSGFHEALKADAKEQAAQAYRDQGATEEEVQEYLKHAQSKAQKFEQKMKEAREKFGENLTEMRHIVKRPEMVKPPKKQKKHMVLGRGECYFGGKINADMIQSMPGCILNSPGYDGRYVLWCTKCDVHVTNEHAMTGKCLDEMTATVKGVTNRDGSDLKVYKFPAFGTDQSASAVSAAF